MYMKKNKKFSIADKEFVLHYLKTFSDTAREPFLILDPDLRIVGANRSFYQTFHVKEKQTEKKLIFEIGNRQWDIPELRKLLEMILVHKTVFNDFEVSHKFPKIGLKAMLLNARQLDETHYILLAIEDVTLRKAIETKLANYTKNLESGVARKTSELKARIDELARLNKLMVGRELKMIELKKEIARLKKNVRKER